MSLSGLGSDAPVLDVCRFLRRATNSAVQTNSPVGDSIYKVRFCEEPAVMSSKSQALEVVRALPGATQAGLDYQPAVIKQRVVGKVAFEADAHYGRKSRDLQPAQPRPDLRRQQPLAPRVR